MCLLYLSLLTGYLPLAADGPAVVDGLTDINSYTVLVFSQPLHVDAYLLIHGLYLFWEGHNITLISCLSCGRNLWQPAFLDVGNGQFRCFRNEVILLD